jgi:tetratricopeptide (TPR) repeat protein
LSHVTEQDLRLFVAGALDTESRRRLFNHLLSGCDECRSRAGWLVSLVDKDEGPPAILPVYEAADYDEAAIRVVAKVRIRSKSVRREHRERERFLAAVRPLHLPFEEILDRVEKSGLPIRARVDALLALSFEERARDPRRMLHLAYAARMTALSLAQRKASGGYSPTEAADLRARAWGELANAYRVNEELPEASHALATANTERSDGTGDPMLHARLLDVEASLRTDQRRYAEAHRLLDVVIELYQDVGETQLAGRALISQGIGLHYDGETQKAVSLLRRGLALLDGSNPQMLAMARKALLDAMAANGEYAEAASLLLKSGLREAFADEPVSYLKVRWVEGRIFAGLGKLDRASTAFADARDSFIEYGLEYEGALVGLEHAAVLLQQGCLDEVEKLASEALEIFEILDIQPEAVRAVAYLHKVCAARKATVELVREVVSFLERLERRPNLRFFYH